jgi:hypothetical protein
VLGRYAPGICRASGLVQLIADGRKKMKPSAKDIIWILCGRHLFWFFAVFGG